MLTTAGLLMIVLGFAGLLSVSRTVRLRARRRFTGEELAATRGRARRRVRRWKLIAYVGNDALSAFLIYMGIRFLVSG